MPNKDAAVRRNALKALAATTAALLLSACVVAAPNGGGPVVSGGGSTPGPVGGFGSLDTQGVWCFDVDGKQLQNELRANGSVMTVRPLNRKGRISTYVATGQAHLWKERGGVRTYEFLSPDRGIWRSNDSRNLYWPLYRC